MNIYGTLTDEQLKREAIAAARSRDWDRYNEIAAEQCKRAGGVRVYEIGVGGVKVATRFAPDPAPKQPAAPRADQGMLFAVPCGTVRRAVRDCPMYARDDAGRLLVCEQPMMF